MQTHPLDFVLSGLALTLILVLTLAAVAFGVAPLTRAGLADYHAVADAAAALLIFGVLCGIGTRLLMHIRPLRPGEYALSDPGCTYWKLYAVIYEFGRGALLPFTTVFAKPLVEMLFGAKIGSNAALGGRLAEPQLITLGDGAVLGHQSVVTPHAITGGFLILRPVHIGARATVGVNAVIMPGVEIGAGAVVTAGSVVTMNTRIPPGELWGGIPARKIKDIDPGD